MTSTHKWQPDHWWSAFVKTWRKIGNTYAARNYPATMLWWLRFIKTWKKIGNAYMHCTPPPLELRGREWFVMPSHAPLVMRSQAVPSTIDHVPVDAVVRSCGTKARYSTEDMANAVAIQCWRDRNVWLRAYSCAICGGWHLTRRDAAPRMRSGWRLPKISERQENTLRNMRKRQRRR